MTTQAYFQNIRNHIKIELLNAKESIYVAVAWFTDRQLFKILCEKASEGLDVQLIVMDDEITRNCALNFNEIELNGGKLFQISESNGTLMHNKFCIIDDATIITGSYNWSVKASSNHENITITHEAEKLAFSFKTEFNRIKVTYHGIERLKPIDFKIIHRRLNVIENLIQLEDYSDITPHLVKLKEFELTPPILDIITELQNANWYSASMKIKEYLSRNQSVRIFDEIKIEELSWQINYFELEIVALENEKTAILKIINDFAFEYTLRFGKIISEILKLKKEQLKALGNERYNEYKKAEQDYQNYQREFKNQKLIHKNFKQLSLNEQQELKKHYRKAASMCHPDIIANNFPNDLEIQKKAEELFKILNDANSNNDLHTVNQILFNLQKGKFDFQKSFDNKATKWDVLQSRIKQLKEKIVCLRTEISALRLDKSYLTVIRIKDKETFFKTEEEMLNSELRNLKQVKYNH